MFAKFRDTKEMYDAYWRDYFDFSVSYQNHRFHDLMLKSGLNFYDVLEVGCGNGDGISKLNAAGKYAVGLEYSDYLFDKHLLLRPESQNTMYPRFFRGDAADMKFEDNQFDMVCSFDVLEHLPEDRARMAVKEIYRVTKRYFYGTISDRVDHYKLFHLTIKPGDWWQDLFIQSGFKQVSVPQTDIRIFAFEK